MTDKEMVGDSKETRGVIEALQHLPVAQRQPFFWGELRITESAQEFFGFQPTGLLEAPTNVPEPPDDDRLHSLASVLLHVHIVAPDDIPPDAQVLGRTTPECTELWVSYPDTPAAIVDEKKHERAEMFRQQFKLTDMDLSDDDILRRFIGPDGIRANEIDMREGQEHIVEHMLETIAEVARRERLRRQNSQAADEALRTIGRETRRLGIMAAVIPVALKIVETLVLKHPLETVTLPDAAAVTSSMLVTRGIKKMVIAKSIKDMERHASQAPDLAEAAAQQVQDDVAHFFNRTYLL